VVWSVPDVLPEAAVRDRDDTALFDEWMSTLGVRS